MGALLITALCALTAINPSTCTPLPDPPGLAPIFGPEPPPIPSHLRLPPRPAGAAAPALHNQGLVRVAYSDPATGVYLGSPSIAQLGADTLFIAHDFFPEWGRPKRTAVLSSKDSGASWQPRALVPGLLWSTLFAHRGLLYLLGTDDASEGNAVSIARSADGGATWNRSALLRPPPGCQFGTGAVPVLLEGGRLWRGMEYWCGSNLQWPQGYHAFLISAPAAADLLDPAAWHATQAVQFNSTAMLPAWMPGPVASGGFLEGNAVRLWEGGVGLLLRCRVYDGLGRMYGVQQACLFKLRQSGPQQRPEVPAQHGRQLAEEAGGGAPSLRKLVLPQGTKPASEQQPPQRGRAGPDEAPWRLQWHGFIDMPGGGNKFLVRYDAVSRRYLALTNPSIDRYGSNPDARNVLVLAHSLNLIDWRIATTVLVPNDGLSWEQSLWYTGYQYADWTIDGEDLLAAIRTAYDGANSFHNSNQVTFKRIQRFRQYLPRPAPSQGQGGTAAAE